MSFVRKGDTEVPSDGLRAGEPTAVLRALHGVFVTARAGADGTPTSGECLTPRQWEELKGATHVAERWTGSTEVRDALNSSTFGVGQFFRHASSLLSTPGKEESGGLLVI